MDIIFLKFSAPKTHARTLCEPATIDTHRAAGVTAEHLPPSSIG
jgi:hypothetical protein